MLKYPRGGLGGPYIKYCFYGVYFDTAQKKSRTSTKRISYRILSTLSSAWNLDRFLENVHKWLHFWGAKYHSIFSAKWTNIRMDWSPGLDMQPAHPMLVVMGADDLRSLAKACPSCYRWRRVPPAVHVPYVKMNEIDRDGGNYVCAVASPMWKPIACSECSIPSVQGDSFEKRTKWLQNEIIYQYERGTERLCSFEHRAGAYLTRFATFRSVCCNIREYYPARRSIAPSWRKLPQYLLWHKYLHIYRGIYRQEPFTSLH
jgi:hypothetical protein